MDAIPEHLPRLYTETEAAKYLDVSIWTVKRRIADGSLRAIPVGRAKRIREDDLLAYIGGAECQKIPKTGPENSSSNAEAREASTASVGTSMDRHTVLALAQQIATPRAKRSTHTR